jgi:hypothetical protein
MATKDMARHGRNQMTNHEARMTNQIRNPNAENVAHGVIL